MQTKTFKVPNIGCDGCIKTIQAELSELDGIHTVTGDVPSQSITVDYEAPATWERITQTLTDIDYAPQSA